MTKASFNIFDELSAWGKTLSVWQRCLLTKLVDANDLSEADIDQVLNEFLIDQGLVTHNDMRGDYVVAAPKFQSTVPQSPPHLQTMIDVSGVNALTVGEELLFGPKLNVVYGPNGSGKSGYARVLKAASFTRSHETKILGDVRLEKAQQTTPTAKFVFSDGSSAVFIYQKPCPRLRDNFAVFDSTCIRVHLDERNAFHVMPYLFDVFPRMVKAFGRLQKKLSEQIASRSPASDKFSIPNSDSVVAQALAALTAKTDLPTLSKLAVFGEIETSRLEEVGKKINELRSTDPKQLIKQNQQKIADLQSLLTSLAAAATGITTDLITKIAQEIDKTKQLAEKSAALSVAQFGGEPVQPVGTSAWRQLLAAAITYHQEAYPDDTFPPINADNPRCVLCQQELDTKASDRLARFYQLATSDVEALITTSKSELDALSKKLSKANTGFFTAESAARRTLKDLDTALEADIAAHVAQCDSLKLDLVQSIANLSVPIGEPPVDTVSKRIKELSQHIAKENEDLTLKDPNEIIKSLLTEQKLLEDRKILSGKYTDIASAVADLKWSAKVATAMRGFSATQRDVTTKQKTLAKTLVAQGFIERFTENCTALKLNLPVEFRIAGDAGTTDRQIAIAKAGSFDFDPSDVLSEGEQTAAALADFLTEVELNGSCAGVIFDDPVTSMDHIRKEAIAQRLVAEAKTRQVIVFTHDILFTNNLAAAAKVQVVDFKAHTVWKSEKEEPGVVNLLAFPHEHYDGAAYDRAKKHFDDAKGAVGNKQRDLLEHACGSLRTAYEDFIQAKLFGDVVGRWRENIRYTLNQVYFDESIAIRVQERLEVLSRYIEGHSHSADHQQVPLTSKIVADELAEFDKIRGEYKTAKKTWEKSKSTATFK